MLSKFFKNVKIIALAALLAAAFILPALLPAAYAAEEAKPAAAPADQYGLKATAGAAGISTAEVSPAQLAGKIIGSALTLIGVVLVVLLLYGGFVWMKARGNEQEVEKAKNIITNAIIGIIIVVAAYTITTFIIDRLAATA